MFINKNIEEIVWCHVNLTKQQSEDPFLLGPMTSLAVDFWLGLEYQPIMYSLLWEYNI